VRHGKKKGLSAPIGAVSALRCRLGSRWRPAGASSSEGKALAIKMVPLRGSASLFLAFLNLIAFYPPSSLSHTKGPVKVS